jgi:hypothetical protein
MYVRLKHLNYFTTESTRYQFRSLDATTLFANRTSVLPRGFEPVPQALDVKVVSTVHDAYLRFGEGVKTDNAFVVQARFGALDWHVS